MKKTQSIVFVLCIALHHLCTGGVGASLAAAEQQQQGTLAGLELDTQRTLKVIPRPLTHINNQSIKLLSAYLPTNGNRQPCHMAQVSDLTALLTHHINVVQTVLLSLMLYYPCESRQHLACTASKQRHLVHACKAGHACKAASTHCCVRHVGSSICRLHVACTAELRASDAAAHLSSSCTCQPSGIQPHAGS
jgi:hypothetical protein